MKIEEYLKEYKLLTDGAMGTYFDKIYHSEYGCSEACNITHPDLVKAIHREYLENGSRLIRTNTFSCNRQTLADLRREYPGEFADISLKKIIQEGFELAVQSAREFGRDNLFVAADIGPIPADPSREREDMIEEYQEICDAFLEKGADIFVMETFPDEKDVLAIASYIKKQLPQAFILAQFSFSNTGFASSGYHYKTVLQKAAESEMLDAVGMNCSLGAIHMKSFLHAILQEQVIPKGKYISTLPNAGYPKIIRGRAVYADDPDYFADKVKDLSHMGASIIGGCCGTTPACIGRIASWFSAKEEEAGYFPDYPQAKEIPGQEKERAQTEKNSFRDKILSGKTVFAVELDPPFDANADKLLRGVEVLKSTKADIITLADSPLARARADSFTLAAYLKSNTGMEVMPHIACRDRNRIAMRSLLLGAYIQKIRNVLVVTGDPVGAADKSNTRGVFDYNSIQFMQALATMNQEVFAEDPYFYGGALNHNGSNPAAIAKRMRMKMEQGCAYFLSQPVYSMEDIERLQWLKEETGAKILIGIMPLVSYKNALFIKNEMPGIEVPDSILSQYKEDGSREDWEAAAIRISIEIIQASKDIGAGYYFMTPFNRVSLIKDILDKVTIDEEGIII